MSAGLMAAKRGGTAAPREATTSDLYQDIEMDFSTSRDIKVMDAF